MFRSSKFQKAKLVHSLSVDTVAPGATNVEQPVKYFLAEQLSGCDCDCHCRTVKKEVHHHLWIITVEHVLGNQR